MSRDEFRIYDDLDPTKRIIFPNRILTGYLLSEADYQDLQKLLTWWRTFSGKKGTP